MWATASPARIPDKLLDDYGLAQLPGLRKLPPPLRRRVVAVTQAGKPRTPLKEFLSRVEQLAGELRGGAPA